MLSSGFIRFIRISYVISRYASPDRAFASLEKDKSNKRIMVLFGIRTSGVSIETGEFIGRRTNKTCIRLNTI